MKDFLNEDFLLETATACKLYHDFAAQMPIIDYHNHLPPEQIAADINFDTITQAWLYGDHYKWRALRANGVDESYCTGNRSDIEKFRKWSETVPYTMRNPLYHWTHLELQRYFGVHELLNEKSADRIYEICSEQLQSPGFSVRNLLRKMNVKVICTTDDPVDSLEHHRRIAADDFEIKVLPAFRPDKAMNADDPQAFNAYVARLESVTDKDIVSYTDYLDALKERHDFFARMGCSVSDHGLEQLCCEEYTEFEIERIFSILRKGIRPTPEQVLQFRSAMLEVFAQWDWEKGWVQQYHLGAMRNNNSRKMQTLGPDTGWDSIGDYSQGKPLARFLDKLDTKDQLAKTILYNLNPVHNELFATMIGNFNDGSSAGKIQYGSGWWFMDQKDGIIRQLNTLSNMGLLSRFVGMLTDSRSFLSFPRHEYFRRILCNLLGNEIHAGELPNDIDWVGKMVQDICYNNSANYFNWQHVEKREAVPSLL